MDSDDIKRYRVKFKYAEPVRLNGILGELLEELDGKSFPEALLQTFIEAYRKASPYVYVNPSGLEKIIADTKSSELYELCKQRNALGIEQFTHLFAAGMPDPELEGKLAAELYKIFKGDPHSMVKPFRRVIIRAMEINGGTISLELLEQIYLELADSIPVREYEFNETPLGDTPTPADFNAKFIDGIDLNAEKSFRDEINSIIIKIKDRL